MKWHERRAPFISTQSRNGGMGVDERGGRQPFQRLQRARETAEAFWIFPRRGHPAEAGCRLSEPVLP